MITASRLHIILVLASLAVLSACTQKHIRKTIKVHAKHERVPQTPAITVWIHGTCIPFGIRFFHAPDLGLWKASELTKTNFFQRHAHLKSTATYLSQHNPSRFSYDHFYFFGWSGKLSFTEREKAAYTLHTELEKVITEYEKQYKTRPYIRIITHSHGGNVAINLAKAEEKAEKKIIIDELVLLACPVLHVATSRIKHPMFKKIYALYSKSDMTQTGDPQGWYPRSSTGLQRRIKNERRSFFSERCYKIQPNLVQGAVYYKGRSLMHAEFILNTFIHALPAILDELDVHEAQTCTDPNMHYAFNIT